MRELIEEQTADVEDDVFPGSPSLGSRLPPPPDYADPARYTDQRSASPVRSAGIVQVEPPCALENKHPPCALPNREMDAEVISERDVESLQPMKFLRGAVIDFYLKYLEGKLLIEERSKCYFFNNWFFTKLCENYTISEGIVSYKDVQKWTKDVDLFEKSYVFIPVNMNLHWSLVIICNLNTSFPYGLHLDSKKGYHDNIQYHINTYFLQEWMARNQTLDDQAGLLPSPQLQCIETEVPQQENLSDCGIYLLHYVERFLLEAFTSGNILSFITKDWFTSSEVASKRMDILNLVLKLSGRSEKPGAAPPGLAMDIMQNCTIAKFSQRYGHDQSEEFRQAHDPVRVDTNLQVAGASRKRQRNQVNQDGPRRDRSSNWTNEGTHVLFRCKREALLAQGLSQRKGYSTAAWKMISEKIPGKSTVQCQRRWDTLKKSMWDIRDYCLEHNKEYAELQKADVARMRLATAYDPDWYQYIDVFCNASSKRKSRSNGIENVESIVEKEIHSTSPQCDSPHQQSLQISMDSPEEKLCLLPVTAPSDSVQETQPQEQENMSYSISGFSMRCAPEVQILMERQEELSLPPKKLTLSELCMQATYPQFQEGQDVVGFSSPGVSRACEPGEQSSMPICLVLPFWLQQGGATSLVFPWKQKDIPGYCDTLSDSTKRILLDILLCSPWSMEVHGTYPPEIQNSNVSVKVLSWWLAIVYGEDALDIMYSLQDFHAKGRDDCKSVLAPGDSLDDLERYLEFAFNEVRRTPKRHENRLVAFEEHQRLTDICEDMAHHEATEVVHLFSCRHLTKLNLTSFINLRSLCVQYCYDLRDISGWDNLGNLAWLTWRHSCVDSFPDTRHLTALQFLELDADCIYTRTITSPPDLSQCHQLRSLTLKWYPMLVETPDMTNLKRLQTLSINFCNNIRSIHSSLSELSGLVDADFSECHQLATLPDLRNLRKLHTLRLSHTQICNIPGVEMLKQLKNLECAHSQLSFLPILGGFAFLKLVDVTGTGIIDRPSLLFNPNRVCIRTGPADSYSARQQKAIPGFHPVPESTKFILLDMVLLCISSGVMVIDICRRLAEIHDRDSQDMMHILQRLYSQSILKGSDDVKDGVLSPEDYLYDLRGYENFASEEAQRRPGWTGSRLVIRGGRRLQRAFEPGAQHEGLKVLVLSECKYLIKINLEGLTNLRYLSIEQCGDVEVVSGWATLKNLAVFSWSGAVWNPSLLNTKHLTSLRDLRIWEDGDSLPRGRHWSTCSSRLLFSIDCIQLTSFSVKVNTEDLWFMVEESPNLTQLKNLQRLSILGSIRKIHSSLSELTTLRYLGICNNDSISYLPSLSKLSNLQVLNLCETALESIPGVEKLVNLRKLNCFGGNVTSLPDLNHLAFLERIDVRRTEINDKASVLCNHNQVKVLV